MNKLIGAEAVLSPLLILGEGEGEVTRTDPRHALAIDHYHLRKLFSLE